MRHTPLLFTFTFCLLSYSLVAEDRNSANKKNAKDDRLDWKSLFDGKKLDELQPSTFVGTGKVSVRDGAILLDKGKAMSGITYARDDFPKTNYEITFEGKRVAGDDFFCTTTFPVGDFFCSLVVGGWGGSTVGLSSIDSADASMNETTKSWEFEKNRWYRVRIRVTDAKIKAWIDEEKAVDLETAGRKLTIRFECKPCKPFGIATWNTTGAIRDVRLRSLTEAERRADGDKPAKDK